MRLYWHRMDFTQCFTIVRIYNNLKMEIGNER